MNSKEITKHLLEHLSSISIEQFEKELEQAGIETCMEFTKEETNKLLDYVTLNVSVNCNISLNEAKTLVRNSILVSKIKESPKFIAHCSMSQLVDMVAKEKTGLREIP